MSKRVRVQSPKTTRSLFAVCNPEGRRVHTSKSRSDAFRIADRFTAIDRVPHTVHALTIRTEREQ